MELWEFLISLKAIDTYGFIGLGAGGDAIHNFVGDHPLFSLFLISSTSGQLIFGNDTALIDQSTPAVVLPSDVNWQVSVTSIKFRTYMINEAKSINLAFDLTRGSSSDLPIMLPQTYYNTIIANLTQISGVQLNKLSKTYIFNGNLTDLPSLALRISTGPSWTLTPDLYTELIDNTTTYRILFQETPISQLSNTTDYITLGWSFLTNLYPVFERKDGFSTISIYKLAPNARDTVQNGTLPPESGGNGVWILILVVVIILIVIVLGWFQRLRTKKREIEQALNLSFVRAQQLQNY